MLMRVVERNLLWVLVFFVMSCSSNGDSGEQAQTPEETIDKAAAASNE